MVTPIVSPRCRQPSQREINLLKEALDDILMPAVAACHELFGGEDGMVLDSVLSLYINLGVRLEGAAAFGETLAEMGRVVPAVLPGIEAEQNTAGRA